MSRHLNDYRDLIGALARQALAQAVDEPPHRPRQGEVRFNLARLRPTARRLLGETVPEANLVVPLIEPGIRFVDGFGHHRPVYRWLALSLHGRATGQWPAAPAEEPGEAHDISLRLWRASHMFHATGQVALDLAPIRAAVGPLHPQGPEDAIDHWTYRELAGLHALHRLAAGTGDAALLDRVGAVARYHQQHTQPDYTTYQPWALAAFLGSEETWPFAEQQLHDVATHLSVESARGGRGAVLPALLLADAWASL